MHLNGGTEPALVTGGTVVLAAGAVFAANETSNTGPILAFVGAILVALLTAYWANRRQAAALAAEQTRLATQLGHDRTIQDVADLRQVVESALDVADRERKLVTEIREVSGDTTEPAKQKRHELAAEIVQITERSHQVTNQLQIRLQNDDPILHGHHDLADAILSQNAIDDDDADGWERARQRSAVAYRTFVDASKDRLGSQIA